jgi:hypothetical protein
LHRRCTRFCRKLLSQFVGCLAALVTEPAEAPYAITVVELQIKYIIG